MHREIRYGALVVFAMSCRDAPSLEPRVVVPSSAMLATAPSVIASSASEPSASAVVTPEPEPAAQVTQEPPPAPLPTPAADVWRSAKAAQRSLASGVLQSDGAWKPSAIAALASLEAALEFGVLSELTPAIEASFADADAPTKWLEARLLAKGLTLEPKDGRDKLGDLAGPTLKRQAPADPRFILRLPIVIPDYGTAVSLIVVRRDSESGRWRTLLRRVSTKGDQLALRSNAEIAVAPARSDGSWAFGEVFVAPHGASRWTGFTLTQGLVLPDGSSTVRSESLQAIDGTASVGALTAEQLSFGYTSWPVVGTWNRVFQREYALEGTTFRRLPTQWVWSPSDLMAELWQGERAALDQLAAPNARAAALALRARIVDKRPDEDAPAQIVTDGEEAFDPADLPELVTVELLCPSCKTFPTRVALHARRETSGGWVIVSVP